MECFPVRESRPIQDGLCFSFAKATAALTADSPPRERALVGALATLFEWPITPEAAARKAAYADAMDNWTGARAERKLEARG